MNRNSESRIIAQCSIAGLLARCAEVLNEETNEEETNEEV
jgi:hypothetical protein